MKHFDIIIVGGGFCGFLVAKKLELALPEKTIALIEPREEFEYTPSIIKIITNADYVHNITIPYASVLKRTTIINEKAKYWKKGRIITNKDSYSYKLAVICSGAHTPCPLKASKVFVLKSIHDAQKIAEALAKAKSVVIVGGGLVGVEVAGELCTKTNKNITLIEPGERLLRRNSESVSRKAEKYLSKKGCRIIYGQRVLDFKKGIVFTNLGTRIPADIAIWCAGIGIDTIFQGGACVNQKGCVLVDEHLRVKELQNVFAGGDITDIAEEKTAQAAEAHAEIISQNISRTIENKTFKSYIPRSKGLVISMGDWNSLFVWKKVCLSGFIPSIIKIILEKIIIFKYKH